jgi:hypothetical protein
MNYPFKKAIIDISNYFFLRKTIRQNREGIEWNKYKLRVDWLNRIYTVVNLPPEVIYSPDSPEEIRPAYVLEESRPINEYLTRLNLQEILIPEIKPIPNSISYLIIYSPAFQKLSIKWLLWRIFLILVIIWSQYKFGALSWTWKIIVKAFEFIF